MFLISLLCSFHTYILSFLAIKLLIYLSDFLSSFAARLVFERRKTPHARITESGAMAKGREAHGQAKACEGFARLAGARTARRHSIQNNQRGGRTSKSNELPAVGDGFQVVNLGIEG